MLLLVSSTIKRRKTLLLIPFLCVFVTDYYILILFSPLFQIMFIIDYFIVCLTWGNFLIDALTGVIVHSIYLIIKYRNIMVMWITV